MNDQIFWQIIDLLDWKKDKTEDILQKAVQVLAEYSEMQIKEFAEILAQKLFALDGSIYAEKIDLPFSVDDFLYVRCYAVSQGKKYYEHILQNPQEIENKTFGSLRLLPAKAYPLKTGQKWNYQTQFCYETYSNAQAWGENSAFSLLDMLNS